jgi:WD40 repeat protein
LAFSADGTSLAVVTETIAVVKALSSGETIWKQTVDQPWSEVAFSEDATQLVGLTADEILRWDLRQPDRELQRTQIPGRKPLHWTRKTVFEPSTDRFAITDMNTPVVTIYSSMSGQLVSLLPGHGKGTKVAAFDPSGDRLATAGFDQTIRIWSTKTEELLKVFRGHTEEVEVLTWDADGSSLVSGGELGEICRWDTTRHQRAQIIPFRFARRLQFTADGRLIITGGDKRQTTELRSGGTKNETVADPTKSYDAYCRDGRVLMIDIHSQPGEIQVQELRHAPTRKTIRLPDQVEVRQVHLSDDGSRLAAYCKDDRIRVWKLSDSEIVERVFGPLPNSSLVMQFSLDGTRLAARTGRAVSEINQGTLRLLIPYSDSKRPPICKVWDVRTGSEILSLDFPKAEKSSAMAISPDGRYLAVPQAAGEIHLFDLDTGLLRHTLPIRIGATVCLEFSNDNSRLASSDSTGAIRLWDPLLGQEVVLLARVPPSPYRLQFSHDDNFLATATSSEITIWDATP